MKIAFLILAHKNPKQLEQLIDVLQHPDFYFFVHVDKKTRFEPFAYLGNCENVFFIKKRAKIYWAGYGTIQATLNGFKEILCSSYDYISVISAQDFPIKPAENIYEYLLKKEGTQFITAESIEDKWNEAAPRIKKYHLINWHIPGKYTLEKLFNYILPARKFPLNLKIVGRSNWFTVTSPAARYILDFLNHNPAVIKYFKYCWGADEFIFSTILYNSVFKDKMEDNLVYVDWSEANAHPKILTVEDFEALKASSKFFARKFDIEKDAEVLEMLKRLVTAKEKLTV
jgi:hypothetical protein